METGTRVDTKLGKGTVVRTEKHTADRWTFSTIPNVTYTYIYVTLDRDGCEAGFMLGKDRIEEIYEPTQPGRKLMDYLIS